MSLDTPIHRTPSLESVTRRQAVRAVSGVIRQIGPWRQTLLIAGTRAGRSLAPEEQRELLDSCERVATEIAAMRVQMVRQLVTLPDGVAAHSRVTDVEQALDTLEANISGIRRALTG